MKKKIVFIPISSSKEGTNSNYMSCEQINFYLMVLKNENKNEGKKQVKLFVYASIFSFGCAMYAFSIPKAKWMKNI